MVVPSTMEPDKGSDAADLQRPDATDELGEEVGVAREAPLTDCDAAGARGIAARAGVAMIRFYQRAISPLTPPACRFHPTCSQYTLVAIQRYGFFRGCWLGFKRIMRCHPFHPGGHDPVP